MFRGPGADPERLDTFRDEAAATLVVACDDHILTLRLAPSYRHLGSRYSMCGTIADEVEHRCSSAKGAYAELRKSIFANRNLSIPTRLQLLNSLVLSRLLYGAPVWSASCTMWPIEPMIGTWTF